MTQALRSVLRCRRSLLIASVALLASLAACSRRESWTLDDITGLMPSLEFSLMNNTGQLVNASDYRGKLVLLYFGYTHCPDVCPTTLATLARAIRDLGPDAAKIRVLFVTVDPTRDTTQVLKRYIAAFGPQFVGLRGNDDALESLAKRYRVAYSRERPDAQDNYAVAHSSAVFIFDGNGKARLLATGSETAGAITQDLRRLLARG
jgi:protein SCO1/2